MSQTCLGELKIGEGNSDSDTIGCSSPYTPLGMKWPYVLGLKLNNVVEIVLEDL